MSIAINKMKCKINTHTKRSMNVRSYSVEQLQDNHFHDIYQKYLCAE